MTIEISIAIAVVMALGGVMAFLYKIIDKKADKDDVEMLNRNNLALLNTKLDGIVTIFNDKFDNIATAISKLELAHQRHSDKVATALGKANQALEEQKMSEKDLDYVRSEMVQTVEQIRENCKSHCVELTKQFHRKSTGS